MTRFFLVRTKIETLLMTGAKQTAANAPAMHDMEQTCHVGMPKHQTTADPRFGPGDEYLIAARLRNYKLYRPSSTRSMGGPPATLSALVPTDPDGK
tara:strand:+ start:612 stop:899 length:288 start_codon:yes stop_codon:yes gene_type:complete